MSRLLGLRTVAYRVPDLEKAKDWYSRALGIKPYFDEPFYVGFNIAGYELGLQPYEGDDVKTGNSVTTYWGVNDIDEAFTSMIKEGANALEQPMDVGSGIKVASVRDPWGNIIGLICNPHFALPD